MNTYDPNKMKKIYMRNHALTIIELLKGWTPEQREKMDAKVMIIEGLAMDILELTNDLE